MKKLKGEAIVDIESALKDLQKECDDADKKGKQMVFSLMKDGQPRTAEQIKKELPGLKDIFLTIEFRKAMIHEIKNHHMIPFYIKEPNGKKELAFTSAISKIRKDFNVTIKQ